MRIVFMGTPDIASTVLERLIADGHDVCGVFTRMDKPQGRHQVLTPPPVKVTALEHNIPVYQPKTLKNGEEMPVLEELQPDVIVVCAYGLLLRSDVLHFPKYGCLNVHASLLPMYRGAAPINWVILNGETETGITIMQMDEGLDTGDMLYQKKISIHPDETAGELFDRMAALGAEAMSEALVKLEAGELHPVPQTGESCYASMLSKKDSPICWSRTAQEIHNQIRGLSPWPGAATTLNGKILKIHRSFLAPKPVARNALPGTIFTDQGHLFVTCKEGQQLELLEVQAQGSKKMSAADYLRGHAIPDGTRFTWEEKETTV